MPNGFGMGGQLKYFGLWLDSDFGKGHSKAKPQSTTFKSPQLSADEEFEIDSLEVWNVGRMRKCNDGNEVNLKLHKICGICAVYILLKETNKVGLFLTE